MIYINSIFDKILGGFVVKKSIFSCITAICFISLCSAMESVSNAEFQTLKEANDRLVRENQISIDQLNEAHTSQITPIKKSLKAQVEQLTKERDDLINAKDALTKVNADLESANNELTKERDNLKNANNELTQAKANLERAEADAAVFAKASKEDLKKIYYDFGVVVYTLEVTSRTLVNEVTTSPQKVFEEYDLPGAILNGIKKDEQEKFE